MSDSNHVGLRKIGCALISVSDKTGIVDFAREIRTFEVEIISTGGTAKALREAGKLFGGVFEILVEESSTLPIDIPLHWLPLSGPRSRCLSI